MSETKPDEKPASYYALERRRSRRRAAAADRPGARRRLRRGRRGARPAGGGRERGARRRDPRVGGRPGARVARQRVWRARSRTRSRAARSPGRSTRSAATTCSSTSPIREPVLRALRDARRARAARLHISIPNARHFAWSSTSCCAGRSATREWGHRDSTHLRWYTRRDLVALVGADGLEGAVGACSGVHGPLRPLPRPPDARHDARVHQPAVAPARPPGLRGPALRVLHLCHCYPPAVGGSETLMAELSRRLVAEHSHAVTVSTTTALSTADFRHPGVPQLAHGESWRTACSCAVIAS